MAKILSGARFVTVTIALRQVQYRVPTYRYELHIVILSRGGFARGALPVTITSISILYHYLCFERRY
ncbi:MAG: hypothetical protein R3E09_13615 [Novosphingobium sp.]|nr:hypothetical protein [Novosphingobium sp.]